MPLSNKLDHRRETPHRNFARNSIEQSLNKARKRCNSNDLNSTFEIVAGELRARLGVGSALIDARAGHEARGVKAGPGQKAKQHAQPHVSDHAPPVWRAPEGPAGLAAVLVGGGGAWPGTPEPQAPPVWRAPESPEGQAGGWWAAAGPAKETTQHQRRHKQPSNPATQTRGSPPGPPRVHATSSHTQHGREAEHSTQSRVQALSAVERPRPRRPGPHSGRRPCAGCRQRRPG